MQVIEKSDARLILTDKKNAIRTWLVRIFLLAAVIIGMAFGITYLTSTIQFVTMIGIGTLFLVLGVAILIRESYTTTATFDRELRHIIIGENGIFRRGEWTKQFDEIEAVLLDDVGTDSASWAIVIATKAGSEIPLSAATTYNKESEAEEIRTLIRSYLI